MTQPRGPFITIEGVDGAGKTSHIAAIVAQLEASGFSVVRTREPGGTDLGERLRTEILHTEMALGTEVLLAFAVRAEHLDKVVSPGLVAGKAVVSDRFTDSTYAFQGAGRGYPREAIEQLEQQVQGDLRPDFTLLFDLSIEEAGRRLAKTEKTPDRFESQSPAFQRRVRDGYRERVAAQPERFAVIDSAPAIEEVAAQVRAAVSGFIQRWHPAMKKPRP